MHTHGLLCYKHGALHKNPLHLSGVSANSLGNARWGLAVILDEDPVMFLPAPLLVLLAVLAVVDAWQIYLLELKIKMTIP